MPTLGNSLIRNSNPLLLILIFFIFGCSKNTENKNEQHHPPFPASETLNLFQIADGFKIELVASEPLIADPVAMEIDEEGKMYVVEMHGYPLDKSGSGKVILLTDSNGNGIMDQRTVFAEGLRLPTGIMRWKKGVIITDAPDVLYLEDQDGDGKADISKVLLTGFALSNPQHNLNTPVFGLDNWIYLAHEQAITSKLFPEEFGDNGKEITFPERKEASPLPVNANGRNVRFKPDSFEMEMLSGDTQFGQTFDTYGNHFLVSNAEHLLQEVLQAKYVNRNPDLLISNSVQSLPDHGDAAEVFPITENPEHQLLTDVGVMTSACGITSYLGGAFPIEYNEMIFVAEPVHNLVHIDKLNPKGATFSGSRVFENKEFLASKDSWFRPVNFYIGPDGALYLVDYYRQIIEHPEWMSDATIQSGDLQNGMDKGRIYRIIPDYFKTSRDNILLADASVEVLINALENKNIWWRRNAQRLLVDKKDLSAIPFLKTMASENKFAPARLHALWTLEGLGHLDLTLIKTALQDSEPGIRKNAIKLAEPSLNKNPELIQSLLKLQEDEDAKVRFQLLCTLGEVDHPSAELARNFILFNDIEDKWVQVAALSSPFTDPVNLYNQTKHQVAKNNTPGSINLISQISATIGNRSKSSEIRNIFRQLLTSDSEVQSEVVAATLEGLAKGMRGKNYEKNAFQQEKEILLKSFLRSKEDVRKASLRLFNILDLPEGVTKNHVLQEAFEIASNTQESAALRADAIELLALGEINKYTDELKKFINPEEPVLVQHAAIRTLGQIKGEEVSKFLLSRWNTLTPELRNLVVDVLMKDNSRKNLLLNGVEQGIVEPSTIGWRRTVSLMNDWDDEIRSYARKLLEEKPGVREEIVKKYETALNLKGVSENGREIFKNSCSLCHQLGGKHGNFFGPDLATIRNRRPEAIMEDILIPNRSIADGYELWELQEKSGKISSGILAHETSQAVTLRNIGGTEIIISRDNIQSLEASKVSAMPPGLENQINEQEMADLIAFIKGL